MSTERTARDYVYAAIFWGALIGGAIGLIAARADAQTTPVTTSHRLVWDQVENVPTAAEAQQLTYLLVDTRDGVASMPFTLVAVTCSGSPYTCQSFLSQAMVDSINRVGGHSLTLTASSATGGLGGTSVPFSLKAPPAAPKGLRLIP